MDILKAHEVIRMLAVIQLPNSPPYVEGVINLRGKVIPIIDRRGRLGLERRKPDRETRIVAVELSLRVMAFVVDAVSEVLRIPSSVMEPPPPIVAGVGAEYITAIGKLNDHLLILLDLAKVFSIEGKTAQEPER